jgi:WD40 repeat protein
MRTNNFFSAVPLLPIQRWLSFVCLLIVLWPALNRSLHAEPPRLDRYGDPLPKGAIMRLGTVRFAQPFPVILAFSPDCKSLASVGSDARIRLWNPDTGRELRTLEGHNRYIWRIALMSDGKWLAAGGQDHELLLWDLDTGKVRHRFRGHSAHMRLVALSPDGKVLASTWDDSTLRLWDTATGKQLHSLPFQKKGYYVDDMVFSPDSKYFAFSDRFDKRIELVDVATGKVIRTFQGHTDHVYKLTFTPDSATLFSCSDDHTIRAWDVASGKEKRLSVMKNWWSMILPCPRMARPWLIELISPMV